MRKMISGLSSGNKRIMGVQPGLLTVLMVTAVSRALVIGLEPFPPDSIVYKAFALLHWPIFLTAAVLCRSGRPFREWTAAGLWFGLTTAAVRQFFVDERLSLSGPLADFISPGWENAVLRAGITARSLVMGLVLGVISGAAASAVHRLRNRRAQGASRKVSGTTAKGGKLAPVWVLLVLAPWTGEFLLGSSPLENLPWLALILPLYGGGALLIRETVVRTGRGWPAVLLLGAAYGVIEAGLIDQSLFNPSFDEYDFINLSPVPLLDFSAVNALNFVTAHAFWSIGVPIALTGLLFPHLKSEPWLGRKGYTLAFALYFAGCAIVFAMIYAGERFIARPDQWLFAAAVAFALICAALATKKKRRPISARPVPRPWIVGAGVFAAHSLFQFRPENWSGVAMGIAALVAAAVVAAYWCRRQGWTMRHELAVTAGATLTCAWCGFVVTLTYRAEDALAWAGNVLFLTVAVLLLVIAARRINRHAALKREETMGA